MSKFIVLEGTDGSGKATQLELLCRALDARGMAYTRLSFPQYDSPAAAPLKMYLNGDFGTDPQDVNPYAASTFFSVDRYASFKRDWAGAYEKGDIILADRYTTSNAVHQGSKEPDESREDFFRWLYEFEYGHMELPKPDIVIYLDVPTELTGQMLRRREHDTHTHADIHEQNMDYLRICRKTGLQAAKFYGWTIINCEKNGKMRSIEDIHNEVFGLVQACLEE